jgi:hypothetical protein
MILEELRVFGNAQVLKRARVRALVSGGALVSGSTQVHEDAQVYRSAQVHGDAWVYLGYGLRYPEENLLTELENKGLQGSSRIVP